MKKNISSLLLVTFLVSCAPSKEDVPSVKTEPTETVEQTELPEVNTARERAKKLLRVIFGGVNK